MITMKLLQFAAVTWWFLYTSSAHAPFAAGPYPTLDLCMAAGHHMDPRDERFMSSAELEAENARKLREAKEAEAAHGRAFTVWSKLHPGKTLADYDRAMVAQGIMSSSTGSISLGPWIVSPCVRVENPDPTAPEKPQ